VKKVNKKIINIVPPPDVAMVGIPSSAHISY
jgi:hypothetical protein